MKLQIRQSDICTVKMGGSCFEEENERKHGEKCNVGQESVQLL